MEGLAMHLSCRSSSEVVSCDLDTVDQGTVTDSSSSSSPCTTPRSTSVSKTQGLMNATHEESSQSSTVTSRTSSLPDPVILPDSAVAATEDASATQQQQQQPDVAQICFDFTKGMCTRGDKCKYSHDIDTIVHFNSKEKGICFDYLRNQCHRGLLCRFSHDLSNIAQQCQVRGVPGPWNTVNQRCSVPWTAAVAAYCCRSCPAQETSESISASGHIL
eukprot:GHUV01020168.1.p1 GENE.GHUV01020168.1~~GHUV01020168.1.p1  ORF type:complete len:217 (+),score=29.48 GHUV01020168.1:254-904(+)